MKRAHGRDIGELRERELAVEMRIDEGEHAFQWHVFETTRAAIPSDAPSDGVHIGLMTLAKLPQPFAASNIDPIGYSELDGRPAFKMAIREVQGRWYLYTGHFWDSGWSVIDVTDPTAPEVLTFVAGPANMATLQVDLAGDTMVTMVTSLEKILPGFGGDPDAPFDEGVLIWDISDPINPRQRGHFFTGGTGTHRNLYAGGQYMHLAAGMAGYDGNIYVIVNISDPTHPVEAGRWWVPGQHTAAGETPAEPYVSLHGPPSLA